MIFGYARVSTTDQNLDAQFGALEAAGADLIYSEKLSGKNRKRPELERLLDDLSDGDVLLVYKYDRLARSLRDLIDIVDLVKSKKAHFKSLGEQIDTSTSTGRLTFHLFASLAEFERERIVERTRDGLKAARERGKFAGRPRALTSEQIALASDLLERNVGLRSVARTLSVAPSTVRRAVANDYSNRWKPDGKDHPKDDQNEA